MKILNLYAGIGGNRKLWGEEHQITSVEKDEATAAAYHSFFPNDEIIVADAHQYLLDHYSDFDFIWSSPPCPTHSTTNHFLNAQGIIRYPDMGLYQEIIFLSQFFKGKYVVENVKPYYTPLIPAQECGRHLVWANFRIANKKFKTQIGSMNTTVRKKQRTKPEQRKQMTELLGFDLSDTKIKDKLKALRNCVVPEMGRYILNCAVGIIEKQNINQVDIFDVLEKV